MKNATSIFYINSVGFLCQWRGVIHSRDDKSVVVQFSKKKACRYNLKALDCPLFIVTKTPVAECGLAVDQAEESVSFDEEVMTKLRAKLEGNIALEWKNGTWSE